MNTQLTTLKTELREFIELSKTATKSPWLDGWELGPSVSCDWQHKVGEGNPVISYAIGFSEGGLTALVPEKYDATFIARSRNISPAMAECLLVAVERLEQDQTMDALIVRHHASLHLQQILNIWEAAK